jgi:hypothetical protein
MAEKQRMSLFSCYTSKATARSSSEKQNQWQSSENWMIVANGSPALPYGLACRRPSDFFILGERRR